MPLRDFRCPQHGKFEDLVAYAVTDMPCPQCSQMSKVLLSAPARTGTLWNAGWNSGLSANGFYSYSAGRQVADKREEEKIMNSRGFVNEKDLGGDSFYDQYMNDAKTDRDKLDATAAAYRGNLKKFEGDKVRAVSETFPAHEMLEQAAAHDAAENK
jgi:hypothetical protein